MATNTVNSFGSQVSPSTMISDWQTSPLTIAVQAAAGPLAAGGQAVFDPSAIGGFNFGRDQGRGTNIRVRILYDTAATSVTTQGTYVLFGRKNVQGINQTQINAQNPYAWEVLPNRAGTAIPECTAAPTTDFDIVPGNTPQSATRSATVASWTVNTHDCGNCDEFMLIPITPPDYDGNDALSTFQVKII